MSSQRTDRITVVVAPSTIDTGQMIQISAIVTDPFGAPVVVPNLFMQILDSKGRVYWPLSTIVKDANGFSKLIATNEMQPNTRYTVRVSTNKKLSPQGWTFFKTTKSRISPAFLTPLIAPLVLIPTKAKNPIWLVYRTMLDSRVCSICRPHEGKKFRPNDPKIIRIGPPELGGQTHYNDRCHYDMQLDINPAFAKVQKVRKFAVTMVAAIRHKQKYGDMKT